MKHNDLVGRIGLRYRPNDRTDLVSHRGKLAILLEDLADIPIKYLEMAEAKWVRSAKGKWMPTAADLIELARNQYAAARQPSGDRPNYTSAAYIDFANQNRRRKDVTWYRDENGDCSLRYSHDV